MNFRKIFSSSVFLKSIFIISISILIFISSISYKHSVSLNDSSKWLTHSYKVHLELEQLITNLKSAESGQHGFIITQDTVFLTPYNTAKKEINISFSNLKKILADNKKQVSNLDFLNSLTTSRLKLLELALNLSSEKPFNKVLLGETMLLGNEVMLKIDKRVDQMIDLEMQYLKERRAKYENEISFTPIGTLFILLFSLLVFIFSYYKMNKDLLNLTKSNKELLIKTESFNHAEEIGGFSSWQWDLKTNKLIYSKNNYKLLGYEPEAFMPTLENFFDLIHPDDKDIILENRKKILNTNLSTNINFRIIRKDGSIRHWVSMSKLLIDSNSLKIRIGINRDITEQYLNNIALEEKNIALERGNKELATFNHAASHDLQEPLRKIQIFISRIVESKTSNLSETDTEYFARIQSAANRMRVLIDDLLLFSRTNKAEKVFEKTDLNILLENATQELAQVIEEKNAVLEAAELPKLNVIPFQIQQLFINLIGNSLKYSKKDITPVIKINCKKIMGWDEPTLKLDAAKIYYKISVKDNGLGFEQQYAESIFTLFQRLHQDSEYSGTGIGLSICKKIVENHNGFISAEGKPGKGATFNIWLPV